MKAHRVVLMLVAMCTIFSVLAPAVASAQAPPACALADFALLGEASTFGGSGVSRQHISEGAAEGRALLRGHRVGADWRRAAWRR